MAFKDVESEGGKWVPEEVGAQLSGILVGRETKQSNKGGAPYPVFTIKDDEGMDHIVWAVLASKLAKVEDGSKIIITFKGSPKGTYSDYSVGVWEDEKPAL